ncbi:hypothetical protein IE4872_PD02196 (plasmid) [Rhizobium gallicum]|uniref:Integrase n=1 Tax=Rhizobium gallicum TaxID=56730 RepID=A0A1L5NXW4_9HYPH|nr:hypothetical protein IE4872_PD02196 [Rhizobium gallicum]
MRWCAVKSPSVCASLGDYQPRCGTLCEPVSASSAEVDKRYVQKQLGHASAELTRRHLRRCDHFRVNLTKATGL